MGGGVRLVHQAGFEPATDGLEIRCSVQLSYWCVKVYTTERTG